MIRAAVIGCGYWGPNLVRNLADIDAFQLVACCDLREDRLAPIARRYPAVEVMTSADQVLTRRDVDAVAIATPISTHHALAKQALRSGKHVLLEKPFTRTPAEAEDLIATARQEERVLMVDHVFVYTGAVIKIKELLDSGELGTLYYFDSVRANLGLFQHDVNVIWDLAVHDISILEYLLKDRPRAVSAIGVSHIDHEHENIAYVVCHYPGNVLGHVHVNWLAPLKVRRTLIGGSRKMIVYDDVEPSEKVKVYEAGIETISDPAEILRARIGYRMGDVYAPQLDRTEGLRRVCEHFAECIDTGQRPLTDGEAGLRVVRVLDAAQRSLEAGGRIVAL
jgi:predicted dehydrogenase